jgi:alpha/beta superfamily hydrolase
MAMMEKILMIPVNPEVTLEARYTPGIRTRSAIICHPHPMYGGSMDNNVVITLQGVFQGLGWGTLRFNFRGVGQSTGTYADGIGEQEDLLAASRTLRAEQEELSAMCLAGYSYGAWVALGAIRQGLQQDALILVSPPVDFLQFDGLTLPPPPRLVTLGDKDAYCAVSSLRTWLKIAEQQKEPAQVEIIPGADHFYRGYEIVLQTRVRDFLRERLP